METLRPGKQVKLQNLILIKQGCRGVSSCESYTSLSKLQKPALKRKGLRRLCLLKISQIQNGIIWFACPLYSTLAKGNKSSIIFILIFIFLFQFSDHQIVLVILIFSSLSYCQIYVMLEGYQEDLQQMVNLFGCAMPILVIVEFLVAACWLRYDSSSSFFCF